LALEELDRHERQSEQPGTPVALDRIQHRIGIEALQEGHRRAEPHAPEE
jgi:hypothetical protein